MPQFQSSCFALEFICPLASSTLSAPSLHTNFVCCLICLAWRRAGERVAVDSRKRGPSDFALWKVSGHSKRWAGTVKDGQAHWEVGGHHGRWAGTVGGGQAQWEVGDRNEEALCGQ